MDFKILRPLFQKSDDGDDRDGLSEIYRDRRHPSRTSPGKAETRYMITAPTFTTMNIAPTIWEAVIKKRILLPPERELRKE